MPSSANTSLSCCCLLSQVNLQLCGQYEDPVAQAQAFSVMPMDELNSQADEAVEVSASMGESPALAHQDAFAQALLDWFKLSFFSWVSFLHYRKCKFDDKETLPCTLLAPAATCLAPQCLERPVYTAAGRGDLCTCIVWCSRSGTAVVGCQCMSAKTRRRPCG